MSNGTKKFTKTNDRRGGSFPRRPTSTPNQANALGNAKKSYERYISLANSAASTGDVVEAENFYQHAEHYLRLMSEQAL